MIYMVVALLVALQGCASVKQMRGVEAHQTDGDQIQNLKITAEVVPDFSLENYRLVKVYFRNLNESWIRIKSVEITGVMGSPNFQVILGRDLSSWRKSMVLDLDLRSERAKKEKKPTARFNDQKKNLMSYKSEDHLYEPMSLPSGLQTQKWVLFQIPSQEKIKGFSFEIRYLDESLQTYRVGIEREQK